MESVIVKPGQEGTSGLVPPGGGYIPPDGALYSTGGAAATGGFATALPMLFMTLAQVSAYGPVGDVVGKTALRNVPLAAALSVAAVVLAGLALALTAIAGREPGYIIRTRLPWLRAYVFLGLIGLAAYSLGLDFLVRGLAGSYRVATLFGALFQILALAAGLYARYGVKEASTTKGPIRRSTVVE